jgi:small subunit ribosomal protein S6
MKKYEAMFILKPDISEEERKGLFGQIGEVIAKNNGTITQASVWAEKKKLYFPLKKFRDGVYYLVNFTVDPLAVDKLTNAYRINENILRLLITVKE